MSLSREQMLHDAEALNALQANESSGRGISCVRLVVSELRRGDGDAASAVSHNEWDKISSYAAIARKIRDMGLVEPHAYISNIDCDSETLSL